MLHTICRLCPEGGEGQGGEEEGRCDLHTHTPNVALLLLLFNYNVTQTYLSTSYLRAVSCLPVAAAAAAAVSLTLPPTVSFRQRGFVVRCLNSKCSV